MSAPDYAAAVLRLVLLTAPLLLTTRRWRRRHAPEWRGAVAALADAVGALSLLVVAGELAGSFGRFGVWYLAAVLWLAAAATVLYDCIRRAAAPLAAPAEQADVDTARGRMRISDTVVVLASCALVVAQWTTWVAYNVRHGIGRGGGPANGDSLWYHMPFAASFVQTGWTSSLQFLNGEALVTYYPANTSLLHAVAFVTMGNDALSVLVNLAIVPVALLAGWCVGEDSGVGPASLAGVAVALTIPVVVVTGSGTAKDDVLGLMGLIAAVAFVVHDRAQRQHPGAAALYGGLAAGLALGSKLTLVAPIAALAVSLVLLAPRGQRLGTAVRWSLGVIATGGYWYGRNLLAIGNPLPGLPLGAGGIRLAHPDTPSMDNFGTSLIGSLDNGRIWRDALLPGLDAGMGAAWPVVFATCAVAMLLGALVLRRRQLVPVVVAVFAFGAFLVTPGTVWAPDLINFTGVRFVTTNLFAFNLRYMLPPVAVALVVVPLVFARGPRARLIVTGTLGTVLVATQFATTGGASWARGYAVPALAAALVVAGLILALMRLPVARVAAVAIVLVAVVGKPFVDHAVANRYEGFALADWAAAQRGARIGYSGFVFSYPLYGPRLENEVAMVGSRGSDGSWHPVRSCPEWRAQLRAERLDFVVVPVGAPRPEMGIDLARWRVGQPGGSPPDEPAESRWTRNDPGVEVVFVGDGLAAYRVSGPATEERCS